MAGITLIIAEEKLTLWLAALDTVSGGQSVRIGDHEITYANLDKIQNQITFWDKQVKRLTRGGIKVTGATPV